MGNSCFYQTPNITLSCVNSGTISSCCRSGEIEKDNMNTALYQWVYTCVNEQGSFSVVESSSFFQKFDKCKNSAISHFLQDYNSWVHLYIYKWKVSSGHKLNYERMYIEPLESEV